VWGKLKIKFMLHLLRKHLKIIIVWGVIFAMLSLVVSLLFPSQYSASSQVLIITRDKTGVDPYTQIKSSERIGENLAQVMKTTDFYNKVMENTNVVFDKTRWQNLSDRDQRKNWKKDVQGSMVYGTGLLNITVYSGNQDDARAFSDAVTQTVTTRGWEYIGGDVTVKPVNNALVSRLPDRPNYLANTIIGFVLGVLLASWWTARYKRGMFGV